MQTVSSKLSPTLLNNQSYVFNVVIKKVKLKHQEMFPLILPTPGKKINPSQEEKCIQCLLVRGCHLAKIH